MGKAAWSRFNGSLSKKRSWVLVPLGPFDQVPTIGADDTQRVWWRSRQEMHKNPSTWTLCSNGAVPGRVPDSKRITIVGR